jgi:hypothetical protein
LLNIMVESNWSDRLRCDVDASVAKVTETVKEFVEVDDLQRVKRHASW